MRQKMDLSTKLRFEDVSLDSFDWNIYLTTFLWILNFIAYLKIKKRACVWAKFAKKMLFLFLFLCFSVKHVSFDINLKNKLIVNRFCERRYLAWNSFLRKTIFYWLFRLWFFKKNWKNKWKLSFVKTTFI